MSGVSRIQINVFIMQSSPIIPLKGKTSWDLKRFSYILKEQQKDIK